MGSSRRPQQQDKADGLDSCNRRVSRMPARRKPTRSLRSPLPCPVPHHPQPPSREHVNKARAQLQMATHLGRRAALPLDARGVNRPRVASHQFEGSRTACIVGECHRSFLFRESRRLNHCLLCSGAMTPLLSGALLKLGQCWDRNEGPATKLSDYAVRIASCCEEAIRRHWRFSTGQILARRWSYATSTPLDAGINTKHISVMGTVGPARSGELPTGTSSGAFIAEPLSQRRGRIEPHSS